MPDPTAPTAPPESRLDRYLRHRRGYAVAALVAFFVLEAVFNSVVAIMDLARDGAPIPARYPVIWEFSSVVALMALLPPLLAFDRRFPLRVDTLRRYLPLHWVATVVFSVSHVLMMVGLRKLAYLVAGGTYAFGNWSTQLFYEYLKDVRTYAVCLAVVYVHRFILLRLQGEASLLDAPDDGPPAEPIDRPDRFLVRKLGKEFLVAATDIEWLQAEGNYVNLHVKGRLYPLRSTMTALEPRLDPARFVRVHRSYMINLDQLVEIEPLESGDARLKLRDGTVVPCSRRYKQSLRARGGKDEAIAA